MTDDYTVVEPDISIKMQDAVDRIIENGEIIGANEIQDWVEDVEELENSNRTLQIALDNLREYLERIERNVEA